MDLDPDPTQRLTGKYFNKPHRRSHIIFVKLQYLSIEVEPYGTRDTTVGSIVVPSKKRKKKCLLFNIVDIFTASGSGETYKYTSES